MNGELEKLVRDLNTTPFLFIGSGISRRYYGLPSWKELLEHFAKKINNDAFAYASYESRARSLEPKSGIFPKIAELIELDFNSKWFEDPTIRNLDSEHEAMVKDGVSPFKAEISMFLKAKTEILPEYLEEVDTFSKLTKRNISGMITTNYDNFLEEHADGYTSYIGQNELVFSPIQGLAEIYKIHGCVTKPGSIIINESDYIGFEQKSAYLAAKLMTIFMEYPIIFLGYSISDANVQEILKSIVTCIEPDKINQLESRLIFVEYNKDQSDVKIETLAFNFDGKIISMTKVVLSEFSLLYRALGKKKTSMPVKMLRMFKQEFYNFTITNSPSAKLRLANIDDNRLEDEELVLAIAKPSDIGVQGLTGIGLNEWVRNIVLEDLDFSADDLLEYAYPTLKKGSGNVPVFKMLSNSTKGFEKCREDVQNTNFDDLISSTFKKSRHTVGIQVREIEWILKQNYDLEKETRLIAHLEQQEIVVDELEQYLKQVFANEVDILNCEKQSTRTNIRRLIGIYDCLKYK